MLLNSKKNILEIVSPRNIKALFLLLFISSVFIFAFAEEDFVYDSKGKHNPFIPLVTPDGRLIKLDTRETVKTGPVLEGIIYDGEGVSFAIINGEIVKEGDIVGDYLVVEITRQKVTFEKEGQITEVPLEKEGE